MVYHIEQTTSTNDDARDLKYRHGDVVWAEFQTAGRGQRGHVWSSAAGENLMFSVVLCPTFLHVSDQFLLSEVVALALVDTFADYGIDARIKWTNDIYVGDRKITGVLIEQNVSGDRISRSVAGIGINVNQTEFDGALPNPVSMAQTVGRRFDRREVLDRFVARLAERYARLEAGGRDALQSEYRARMYRLGVPARYRLPSGETFVGEILGVRPSGALSVRRTDDGSTGEYLFREIEFVIAGRD